MSKEDRKTALDNYQQASMGAKSKESIREFHAARAKLREVNRALGAGRFAK